MESGLLAGLSESGVDLARVDFIVGTSAGSFVGAQVAVDCSASSIVDAILAADPAQLLSGAFSSRSSAGRRSFAPQMRWSTYSSARSRSRPSAYWRRAGTGVPACCSTVETRQWRASLGIGSPL